MRNFLFKLHLFRILLQQKQTEKSKFLPVSIETRLDASPAVVKSESVARTSMFDEEEEIVPPLLEEGGAHHHVGGARKRVLLLLPGFSGFTSKKKEEEEEEEVARH